MIKFFRRIRQRLLAEGRLSSYLAYAIGEILLVVIGILIALQINNSSEEFKERKAADKLHQEILAEFEKNQENLQFAHKGAELYVSFLEEILQKWDSLDYETFNSIERHPFAEDYISRLFYLTSYSQFVGSKKDVYLKAVGDGTLTLVDKDFISLISSMHRTEIRMDEMISQEYEMGKEIQMYIANEYDSLFQGFTRDDSRDIDPETLDNLFIAFRADGTLKYMINTRLDMAKVRSKLIALENKSAKEYLNSINPELDD